MEFSTGSHILFLELPDEARRGIRDFASPQMDVDKPAWRGMKFFLRRPVFPILVDTGKELIVLRTAGEGERRLAGVAEAGAKSLDVIDARVEGFAYYPEHDVITPLTLKKVWRKAEIVALYNARKHPDAPGYAPSLSARKLPSVLADVMELVRPRRAGRGAR